MVIELKRLEYGERWIGWEFNYIKVRGGTMGMKSEGECRTIKYTPNWQPFKGKYGGIEI